MNDIRGNMMRKMIFAFLLAASLCHSQTKTVIREYTYQAGEADSKITARAIALEQVKRILLEEIGVYIQSAAELKDWERTQGKESKSGSAFDRRTTAITAGVTETTILEEKWDGERFYIRAQISVDTADVAKRVQSLLEKDSRIADLEDSRKRANDALEEIERLQNELKTARSESDRLSISRNVAAETKNLDATEWFERGYAASQRGKPEEAQLFYTKAVELNPQFSWAYYNRGCVKADIQDVYGAIADYTIAIELSPDLSQAYYNRGLAKGGIQDYQGEIADYTRGIELRPDMYMAYYNRGCVKATLHDDYGAIADFTRAVDLKPDLVEAYFNRANSKASIGDQRGKIADLTVAIELKPNFAWAYCGRGAAKSTLGDQYGAISDFSRAIEFQPDYALAYNNRGCAKMLLGDSVGGCNDLNKAAALGEPRGLEYFRVRGACP